MMTTTIYHVTKNKDHLNIQVSDFWENARGVRNNSASPRLGIQTTENNNLEMKKKEVNPQGPRRS